MQEFLYTGLSQTELKKLQTTVLAELEKAPNQYPYETLESRAQIEDLISLVLENNDIYRFYTTFPSLTFLKGIKEELRLDQFLRLLLDLFIHFKKELDSPKALPLFLILHHEVFNDHGAADEAWAFFFKPNTPKNIKQMLFIFTAPAPFDLKKEILEKHKNNSSWHPYLVLAIYYSIFENEGTANEVWLKNYLFHFEVEPGFIQNKELKKIKEYLGLIKNVLH